MDLNALQLKIDNYITVVSSWVRNVGKLYFSGTPENVTVELIDDNGNLVTKTLPNVAQFRKRVWDDVGGALGQFNRTFYVDNVNGDDTNDGSKANPLKTIKKAVDSIPIGGAVYIHLLKDNNLIDNDINAINKSIFIYGSNVPDSSNPTIKNDCFLDNFENATHGFILTNCYLEFYATTIQTANFVDSSKNENYYSGIIKRTNTASKNKVILRESSVLAGDTDFIRLSNRQDINLQVYYVDTVHNTISNHRTFSCNGPNRDGKLVNNECGTMILNTSSVYLGTKNDGSTSLSWGDLVTGIVKDGNGVPRNILSDIIF